MNAFTLKGKEDESLFELEWKLQFKSLEFLYF